MERTWLDCLSDFPDMEVLRDKPIVPLSLLFWQSLSQYVCSSTDDDTIVTEERGLITPEWIEL